MISTFASYKLTSRDIPRALSLVSEQPLAAREIAYFKENIQNIKTIDEFIGDNRIFTFAMQALGLGEMSYAKAFMAKALREGTESNDAFVNTLTDPRYREFAETFDFARFGSAATSFTKANEGVVDRYLRQTLEEQAGSENEGVRLALYFSRKAPEIESYYEILAEPALAEVVRTALAIPTATATVALDKQVELISDRLDIADFKDPAKLEKFLERFTSLWDVNNPQTFQSPTAGLFFGNEAQSGVSGDLMLQIQQMRR